MDFFEHQDRARRSTSMLIVYFAFAVLMVVLSVYTAMLGIVVFSTKDSEQPIQFFAWHPQLFFGVSIVVTGLITLGSFYKIWSLGGHGENVARQRAVHADDHPVVACGDAHSPKAFR